MNVGLKNSRRRDDAGIAIYRAEITNVNKVVGEHSPLRLEIQPAQFIVLTERWRVRLNDPAQWVLEYRLGRPSQKSTGWRGSSYCTQRRTLLRDIREKCGEVDPAGLRQVETLPARFPCRRTIRTGHV